jgi:hypothetical protein
MLQSRPETQNRGSLVSARSKPASWASFRVAIFVVRCSSGDLLAWQMAGLDVDTASQMENPVKTSATDKTERQINPSTQ